jgi:transcriptional regulator with XRE-family HTH domain
MALQKGSIVTAREKRTATSIARTLHKVRKHRELSQKDVAKALGITQSTLSKMEHGKLIPSAVQWYDFCQLTKIPMDSLFSPAVGGSRKARKS